MLCAEGGDALNEYAEDRGQGGFTLLELLVAVFIFAIVISSVYGAYRSSFFVINSTESQGEYSNMARIALDRLTSDLEGLYAGDDGFLQGESVDAESGRADRLTFASTSHLLLNKQDLPAGMAAIGYAAVVDDTTGLLQLYRKDTVLRPGDTPAAGEEDRGYLVCDRLSDVRFAYIDGGGNESDAWDSTEQGGMRQQAPSSKFPRMIKITLRFAESAETEATSIYTTAIALPRLNSTDGQ